MRLLILCVVLSAMASAAFANVFASQLTQTNPGTGSYTLAYRLNEPADSVTVNIKGPAPSTTVIKTISAGAQTTGSKSVIWDGTDNALASAPAGTYTWEVVASCTAGHSAFEIISPDASVATKFYTPYGVDINGDQTSPYFGTVYVSNGQVGTTSYGIGPHRNTPDGIYILTSDLEEITTACAGGVTWGAGSSPRRCRLDLAGNLFISDFSDPHSGMWIMDPANPTGSFSELFDSSITRAASGLRTNLHGSIAGMWIGGTGAGRYMLVVDEDMPSATAGNGSVYRHNIGTATSGWNAAPTLIYDDATNGKAIINSSGICYPDAAGTGLWVSQYRYTESATNPNVIHVTAAGAIDWKSATNLTGQIDQMYGGSMALNANKTKMACGGVGYLKVFDITAFPTFTLLWSHTWTGNNTNDVNFDVAGNVYLVNSSLERLRIYSPPGANSFTTASPAGQSIVRTSDVKNWLMY